MSDLYQLIAAVHAPPEWACFREVGNATGARCSRHADAVAMSIWPSRGLIIRGFEIKQSRTDYRREAADPEKAEAVARFCDEWWIVTPDGLIRDIGTELPPAWGLMVPNGKGGLRTVRAAEKTEAAPLTRTFLAAVLRKAQAMVAKSAEGWVRREEIQEKIDAAEKRGRDSAPRRTEIAERDLTALREKLEHFRAGTGIDLTSDWRSEAGHIVECYRAGLALLGEYGCDPQRLQSELKNAARVLGEIQSRLAELPTGKPKGV